MSEEPVAAPGTISHPVYKLKRNWTWWYLNDERNKSWEERLKNVKTFSSVGEFWALHDSIKPPSGLNPPSDYNVFRDGIEPMWEVPQNQNGGRWLITIEKGRTPEIMDTIWTEILMAMIGEQFSDDIESLCGIVCNVRGKGSKISVWTTNSADDGANLRIGGVLKQVLNNASMIHQRPLYDVLRYEDHESCQKKTSSGVKAKHAIYAVEPREEKAPVPVSTETPATPAT
ncbi:Eukaryotic translation initiation factor 4E-2 [Caenorhabditis elegans]|uniref:Eukaryotic translation initiation factor 4E-2 n=1 Tax=Caenorhabditis elegans TaxID=6239 RepID=IF4E2_CAEEL|nr:Eukaryotic translation initiation factor 4E-2 [Caenorhabditis elegans]Q21693.1 RecName: Full=Eukaryotic translation initiation factor 4E-2; Short=eIF-4E-2; Short=eIF4E-2; AltName: Full=eIF-4F 25 kDa subunit; AltName: Full=mRNA cap-binding protein [Caenorhabditis elegans]CCD62912.1 Eukaryotic translation initiation factor 4E-2 [Caenorhabditis elegans]|eukprot:NP_508094.1 Eukaryotic translation initiation factor 4E-2 [Caenorhabditis elegans]